MLRTIVGVILGLVLGGLVNMGLVMAGPMVIPTPPGVDVTTTEGLQATAHLLEPRHYVFPFLAHALGTLVGALSAFLISGRRAAAAWVVGIVSLAGGIAAASMIPAPTWFVALDLVVAYLPMAWLAMVLGRSRPTNT